MSARGSDLPGAPQDEAGLTRKFAHRDVPVGAKNIPHRLRFTRALLESKDTWVIIIRGQGDLSDTVALITGLKEHRGRRHL